MLRNISLYILLFFCFSSCKKNADSQQKSGVNTESLISYVNPFIGTGGHGHTYPGATMPFGMMQLSPDTRLDGWDGCSGYHYSDEYIYGFSHTHLSGTGVSDYGDILLMPTNKMEFNNGANGEPGYRAHFSHQNEVAQPAYYSVYLDDTEIDVALTVSERSGIHKYEFPSTDNQYIILDLEHRDKLLDHKIEQLNARQFQGYRYSEAWATNQQLFYFFELSHDAKVTYSSDDNPTKAALQISNPGNEPVYVKIGISAVDEAGARKNMEQEIGELSFEEVKQQAQQNWESQLSKIKLQSDDKDKMVNFYTSLYHTMIAPNLYQDVDGRYRGMDLNVHQATDFDYYTVFSLWDTYRAAHPLYTIIEQERTNDFINTFLAKYDEGGIMPIWDLSGCYTGCMIGYHSVPVIADAYLKGITKYDTEKALEAMKHSAMKDHLGLESYKKMGYVAVEKESESVSKTLEYAYDDWTIAQMAKKMGKQKDYEYYTERAQCYKNVFDPQTQFMRGRFRNSWFSPFDPYEVNFNYTEANSWQYSYYVPQDVSGFMNLLGGKDQLEAKLDELFTAKVKTSGREQADITGLIGQYAHGNEPSHHMAYLYNFVNKPQKTQERVHEILTQLYTNTPDGISGNEDCGQMSAWYIFSSLGFYPVTPGSNQYIIGAPLFPEATIHLENGKQFTVIAENVSDNAKYIASAELNGKALHRTYLNHEEIMAGGTLTFTMANQPTDWGTKEGEEPVTKIDEHVIVAAPFISKGDLAFNEETSIELKNVDPQAAIFYSVNDGKAQEYKEPIVVTEPISLEVFSEKDGKQSAAITTDFFKVDPNISITLGSEYANQYNAGGDKALIDGILGAKNFKTGSWQGYHNTDVVATVHLSKEKPVKQVRVNFLQDQRSWIFYPTAVECFGSVDGKNFTSLGKQTIDATKKSDEVDIVTTSFTVNKKYNHYKIVANTLGELPEWHLGYEHDGRSWVFIDEIILD